MTTLRSMNRALLPTAGVVAAVATAVSGWAPIAQSAPEAGTRDTGVRAPAQDADDGTYESCAAYFGFGKAEFGVLDVVDFDVFDQNGDDGVDHAVPDDTEVVLVLTNEEGATLECAPFAVSEEEWDEAMNDLFIFVPEGGRPLPAWPGPGHFAYPSVSLEPFVEDFGRVVDVGFRVTTVPDGHTLVSPTGVRQLVQHFLNEPFRFQLYVVDPRVLDVIEAAVGTAPRDAFEATLPLCDADKSIVFDADTDADLIAAVNALNAFRGFEPQDAADIDCFDVGGLNADVSLILGLEETVAYVEPIVLAVPEEPPPTTTTPTIPPDTVPPGSEPPVTDPPVSVPPGTTPPGAVPPGAVPPGTTPPVVVPPGAVPIVGTPVFTG